MQSGWASRRLALALVVAAAFASPAPAAEATAPAAAQEAAASVAAADSLQDCVSLSSDFQTHGQRTAYVISLENKCEKRLKCIVYANVTGARGSSIGHATLVLAAKSTGVHAKNSYEMRVKEAGGIAQISRDCQAF